MIDTVFKILLATLGMATAAHCSTNIVLTPKNYPTVLAAYTQAINTDGLIDKTFCYGRNPGASGIAIPGVGTNPATMCGALQPDGKILVGGSSDGRTGATNGNFVFTRINSDGSPDSSFNNGTPITGNYNAATGPAGATQAIVVQPDGKIIVGGGTTYIGGNQIPGTGLNLNSIFCLQRYNSDGTIDTSFNNGNPVVTAATNTLYALLLQPNGSIVAVGNNNVGGVAKFTLVRYLSSGSIDPSFNGGVAINTTGANTAYAAVLQSDGKIVALGNNATPNFTLVRYNSDGSVDTSFGLVGNNNIVTTANTGTIYGAALQPDGKIIAVGTDTTNNKFCIVRYNTNGSVDQTFNGGSPVIQNNTAPAKGVALQPDGKIVVVGGSAAAGALAARYNTDGSLDTTFGPNGSNVVVIPAALVGAANGVMLQADNKIVGVCNDTGVAHTYLIAARLTNPLTLQSFNQSYGGVGML